MTLSSRREFLAGVPVVGMSLLRMLELSGNCAEGKNLPTGVRTALAYIAREHDRFHESFVLFDDHCSGGCHMFPSGWMGDLVPPQPEPKWVAKVFDELFSANTAEGRYCLKVVFPAELAQQGWKQWVACAWETHLDPEGHRVAYDLRRYLHPGEIPELRWFARGDTGREIAGFKRFETEKRANIRRLKTTWESYSLQLSHADLSKPLTHCFVWATNTQQNPRGSVIYLDHIRIQFGKEGTKRRLKEPRFIRSYFAEAADTPDKHFRNACFVYDQALALSALVASGRAEDLVRAKLLADAFVYVVRHDRAFKDGRIRNGYLSGDLAIGLGPSGPQGATRLPGWWDFKQRKWFEDIYFASSDCGNTAWAILGLLNYWEACGKPIDSVYLKIAAQLAAWIDKHAFDDEGPGGFRGGLEGFEPAENQRKLTWKSTEHAIDLYVCFRRLHEATGDPRFRVCARHAEQFVDQMWNSSEKHLWTGTKEDGRSVNPVPIPMDVQAWSVLAFRSPKKYPDAIAWVERRCRVALPGGGVGFDFNDDRDGIWWEGTGQMVVALRLLGREADAQPYLTSLREHGTVKDRNGSAGAIYAADRDGLTTGFWKRWAQNQKEQPWVYYRRPHLGATCWYIFAELGWNPYWGERVRAVE